jgi:hypothetical protein
MSDTIKNRDIAFYSELLAQHTELTDRNIADVILHYPSWYARWIHFHALEAKLMDNMYQDLNKLTLHLYNYYAMRCPTSTYRERPFSLNLTKTEITIYSKADPLMVDAMKRIKSQEILVEYIEQACKTVNNIQWAVKNHIEYQNFINGVT